MFFGGGLLLIMAACVGGYDYYDDRTTTTIKERPVDNFSRNKIIQLLRKLQTSRPAVLDSTRRAEKLYEDSYIIKTESPLFFKGAVIKRVRPNGTAIIKHKTTPRRKWRINRPIKYCLLKICGPHTTFSYDLLH